MCLTGLKECSSDDAAYRLIDWLVTEGRATYGDFDSWLSRSAPTGTSGVLLELERPAGDYVRGRSLFARGARWGRRLAVRRGRLVVIPDPYLQYVARKRHWIRRQLATHPGLKPSQEALGRRLKRDLLNLAGR